MENKIIDVLQKEGSLATTEIAIKIGFTKAKDIQKTLNKLLKSDIITKRKVNSNLLWELSNEQIDLNDASLDRSENRNIQTQSTTKRDINSTTKDFTAYEFLEKINNNQKEEIAFLRNEIKEKNELIKSQQKIINILVEDNAAEKATIKASRIQDSFLPYDKTFKPYKNKPTEKEVESVNQYKKLAIADPDKQERFRVYDETSDSDEPGRNDQFIRRNTNKSKNLNSRPRINNHVTNDNTKEDGQLKGNPVNKSIKPLVLVVGDSTTKHTTSYDMKKVCGGTNVMVRSLSGGKIKNIRNLIIDTLEDVTPEAILVHVSTNDISNGKNADTIAEDMENLVSMIDRQGIIPVISLVIPRNDKHATKVDSVNRALIEMCNKRGVAYIEHENITNNHLNPGGIHLTRQYSNLLNNNFVSYINYLVENDFCVQ